MFEAFGFDLIGVTWLFLCWTGYTVYSENSRFAETNLIGSIGQRRVIWMTQMLGRDNRMVDIQIINSLMDVVRFLASTSILIIAGLLALLGATDQAILVIMDLPFAAPGGRGVWEAKILLLILIFVYAFFKFMWSMRQYTYCSVMVGAAPPPSNPMEDQEMAAHSIARVTTLASRHSNHGTRAYYFGLATLSWFVHPLLLIPSALWVVLVLHRREFRSRTLEHIRRSQGDDAPGDGSK
ncbi:MAG: DUF599 domain-containing protein [Rhodospirillaceae bacterium]|nr:DUF599 domain-containing protein [Rhodospirillaceae bacterium]MBT5809264.1 DUF599 domain-containing protein [Rhodospirillaceae bacterium]